MHSTPPLLYLPCRTKGAWRSLRFCTFHSQRGPHPSWRDVCMHAWSALSVVWINRVRLPILLVVLNLTRKVPFPCPRSRLRIWSRETGSAVPSRVSPLILYIQAESDWLLCTHGIPPVFCGSGHLSTLSTAIGSVPSLSGHTIIAYRWRSLPRVRRHKANNPHGNSSNRYCLFRLHHGPIFMRLAFPAPTIGM